MPGRGAGCHRDGGSSHYVRGVASIDDAAQLALELPGVTEDERRGDRRWQVAGKVFAWERPFSKADIKRFGGQTPPGGPVLAVRVADLAEKEAVLAATQLISDSQLSLVDGMTFDRQSVNADDAKALR